MFKTILSRFMIDALDRNNEYTANHPINYHFIYLHTSRDSQANTIKRLHTNVL